MERKTSPESVVREIRKKTRKKYTAEEKIRIVLEGLRGMALRKTGVKNVKVKYKPRLLSDNGPCCLSNTMKPWTI